MNGLIAHMVDCPIPILVVIHGQCLGGGLEIATAGNLLFISPDTQLGQPEIIVGVFAPAASCLLPELVGQARAEDLLFSGRSISADEALSMGLVAKISDDPESAALAYFDRHLASKSGIVLRYAVKAARSDFAARVKKRLLQLEEIYLERLMNTKDAVEGLNAFLEKREASWSNR